ncbi:MAG: tandem-95 repeat protein [Deltaproteobacteria bacterium]|nr:tandem-95 repeat protein [Deltaproteobacteria bacterium]
MAVSPNYVTDHTVFTGSLGGRIYKTMDGGANWTAVGINTRDSILALAVSPNYSTDNTIFAGVNTVGIYKTTNGGASWTQVLFSLDVRSFAISPNYANDRTIFAGTNSGVYKSTDSGASWTAVNSGISNTYYICYLAISPNYANDQTIYVGGRFSGGVYKSTNGGASWTAVNSGISTNTGIYSIAISPNFSTDQTVYAGTAWRGVYKTTNGGSSWTAVGSLTDVYVNSLSLSPNYITDQTVYAGTSNGVYKSTDSGLSWTAVNSGLTVLNILSLAVSPDYATEQIVYSGTIAHGVFETINGGASWVAINKGISSSLIVSLAISPSYSADNTVFAGSSNGGVYKTTDGGISWIANNSGLRQLNILSLAVSPNYTADRTVFAGIFDGLGGVYKTTDGGANWYAVNTGMTPDLSVVSLAISPNYAADQTVYAGLYSGKKVYKTTNGGASWTSVYTGTTPIFSLAISPNYASDRTVYIGTAGSGIYKTTDGGANWTPINLGVLSRTTSIAISPNYAADQTVYAGTDSYGIFKTTNGGANWVGVNSGITSTTIHSIAVSPNYATDHTVFAGTGYGPPHGGGLGSGVFKSTNGGTSWTTMNSGLPTNLGASSPTIAISSNYTTDHTVFAGTFGFGVFSYTLIVNTPPVASSDTKSTAEDTALIFSASDLTANDTDADGDSLTVTAVTATANTHGTVTLTGGIVTYTPDANFNGSGSFTYTVSDGKGATATATVTVTVTPVNDPPVLSPIGNKSVNEGQLLTFTISGSDVDGNSLTYSASNLPSGASFNPSTRTFSWTPTYAQAGSYPNVRFSVSDGTVFASEEITIDVINVNSAPVSNAQNVTTAEDTSAAIVLTGSDPDGDALTFTLATQPTNGSLTGTPPNLTYTPNPNFNGSDSFTFTASDGFLTSAPATISITVTFVNDLPVANDDAFTVTEDSEATSLNVLANDTTGPDAGETLAIISAGPGSQGGTVAVVGGTSIAYTPAPNFFGIETFTYTISDGNGGSATATVTVTVPQAICVLPPSGLVSWWSGDGHAKDIQDNNHGTLQFGATFEAGKVGQGFRFDGLDDYVLIPRAPSLEPQQLTIEAWSRAETVAFNDYAGSAIVGKDIACAYPTFPCVSYGLFGPGIGGQFTAIVDFTDGTRARIASSPTFSLNTLYHVAMTWDGSALKLYVNGQLEATQTIGAKTIAYDPKINVSIGREPYFSRLFKGLIDEVSIYNRALSASEIQGIFNASSAGKCKAPIANAQNVTTAEDTPVAIVLTGSDSDGDPLTFTVVTQPVYGTLSGTPPNLTYTPNPNFNGSDSFTFTASDAFLTSAPATISITVSSVNDLPVLYPVGNKSVSEGQLLTFTIAGSDIDGNPLTYSASNLPAGASFNPSTRTFSWTPTYAQAGTYPNVRFLVSDGTVSASEEITISVFNVNLGPVSNSQNMTTTEDTSTAIVLTGSDPDGDALLFAVATQPTNGSLSGTPPNLTYTPNPNFNGSDSFSFTASDGLLTSAPATISITVTPVNDPPVANNDAFTVAEDSGATSLNVLANDTTGPDTGETLTIISAGQGSQGGTVAVVGGTSIAYTPASNFFGLETFAYTISDGNGGTATATVTVSVTPVNDAPTANPQNVTTAEDTAVAVTLTGSDPEGNALAFTVVTQPSNGILSGTPPNLTYTPTANFNGSDSFTFKVNDGSLDSNAATVSITVNAVNDAPMAANDFYNTDEDTAFTLFAPGVLGNDQDLDSAHSSLTAALVSGPAHALNFMLNADGSFSYTPEPNFNGTDTFTYKVSDGALESDVATVTITVNPVNDAPVATNDSYNTDEDTALAGTTAGVLANDNDIDTARANLTAILVTGPSRAASFTLNPDGSFSYTPQPNFNGTDSFTYKANDGANDSNVAMVTIAINPLNDAPVAQNDGYITAEETMLNVPASGVITNDQDIDTAIPNLIAQLVSAPARAASFELNADGSFSYTPVQNFSGVDTFTYRLFDGTLYSNEAMVQITVTNTNDAPVAQGQSVTTSEDTAKIITLSASDLDSQSLAFAIVNGPTHGSLGAVSPPSCNIQDQGSSCTATLTYIPGANYNGSDSFSFKVNDGSVDSNVATVNITVSPVNDPPMLYPVGNKSVSEGQLLAFTISGSDIDGDLLSYSASNLPYGASFNPSTRTFSWTPTYAQAGSYSNVRFSVSDGTVSASEEITIDVINVNRAPVSNAQDVTTAEDTAASIVLTGSDPDGDALTFTLATQPANGSLSGTAPTLTYTPNPNFNGSDSFTFTASDGLLTSAPATISITVTPVNDLPVADNDAFTVAEDSGTTSLDVLANDTTGPDAGETLTIISAGAGSQGGTVAVVGGTSIAYTPAANFFGVETFTYTISDGNGGTATALVSVTVTNVNDNPITLNDTATVAEDSGANALDVLANDSIAPDAWETLTIIAVTQGANGTVMIAAGGAGLTYQPNANSNGTDSFTYTVSDGNGGTATATVAVLVTPVNDLPLANAGLDQTVNEWSWVALDGSGSSDQENSALTFRWAQVPTPSIPLDLSDPAHPRFEAPSVEPGGQVLTFQLIVNDGELDSEPATVNIVVKNVNRFPVTEPGGSQTVNEDSLVTLDGSKSWDPDSEPLAYSWRQTGGPEVTLSDPNSPTPSFTAPLVGREDATLTFELTVSDPLGATGAGSVNVLVENVNHVPVAMAGADQTRNEGTVVTLNGSASSDPDSDPLTYSWTQLMGPAAALSDSTSATPSFTAPLVGPGGATLVFGLVVNDGLDSSSRDEVTITVLNVNDPPVCALAQPSLSKLWPPDHKLISLGINQVTDPDNDGVVINISRVTQDEPVNGLGDGDTGPDAVIQGNKALLRAERSGTGNGRVYRVYFSADDGQGGMCDGSVKVEVPLSMKSGVSVVDDGHVHESTQQ